MNEIEIAPAAEFEPDRLRRVLEESFGRHMPMEHYRWKHLDAPWGPSRGWVATMGKRPVGVRLFTPWEFQRSGRTISGARALDGGVVPDARRRGIFELLVRTEMEHRSSGSSHLIMSTAVPASHAAYVKAGWIPVGTVAYSLRPVVPAAPTDIAMRPSGEEADEETVDQPLLAGVDAVTTNWTARALAWRSHPQSGHRYHFASLRRLRSPHGLIFRTVRRPPTRVLVPLLSWGDSDVQELLARKAATRVGAIAVLEPTEAPGANILRSRGFQRGGSAVIGHAVGSELTDVLRTPERWQLAMADLEGVL